MARGVNKAILIGNLGGDPEVRYTQQGTSVVTLSVATSDGWRDKQTGQVQERTEWHRVVLFQRLAEIAGEYLKKGSKVYIEGRIQTRKWQDQQGQDRWSTEIVGLDLQMLDRPNGGTAQQHQQRNQYQGYQQPNQGYQQHQQQQPPSDYNQGRQQYNQPNTPPRQQQQPPPQQGPVVPPEAQGFDVDDDIPF